jgi:putative SOS response-associated peptidase YedK
MRSGHTGEKLAFLALFKPYQARRQKVRFRDAIFRHGCLIPADSFYERQRIGTKEKQPYSLGMVDDALCNKLM